MGSGHQLLTCVITDKGKTILPLLVGRIWFNDITDIAFMHLLPAADIGPDHVWDVPRLELRPPVEGSRIFGFGYPRSAVSYRDPQHAELLTDASTTTGTVIRVHHARRDALLPFPCFQTDARFDPGMSGGPVFNEAGHVCGLITSSLPAETSDGEHFSHVATLWPSLGTIVDFDWEPVYPKGAAFPIYEVARRGIVNALHIEDVVVRLDAAGRATVSTKYPGAGDNR